MRYITFLIQSTMSPNLTDNFPRPKVYLPLLILTMSDDERIPDNHLDKLLRSDWEYWDFKHQGRIDRHYYE
jgi:hypothetical protein